MSVVAEYHESAAAARETHHDLPRGIIVGGPLVRAKQTESFILFGIFMSGSIAGLTWAFTQGLSWIEWSMFGLMYSVTTLGLGITVHRYLVHRSFKAGPVVKFILCAMGQMTCQGSLLKWVGNHRRHHQRAMGEIEHAGDAEDEGETRGAERIERTDREAVDQDLPEHHGVKPRLRDTRRLPRKLPARGCGRGVSLSGRSCLVSWPSRS